MPAPYLRRVWLDPSRIADRAAYPFCLPFLRDDFELSFDRPITIIVGENGTGKSTFLEAIAVLAGYDEAGGGKGYMPVDHSERLRKWAASSPRRCAPAGCRASPTAGSFARRAFSRSRDTRTRPTPRSSPASPMGIPPDYLSHSHGEGFLRFFEDRCRKQGIFIFDEPESALSPARQMEFLKLMRRMEQSRICQVVMAYPGARLLRLSKDGLEPVTVEETDHYRIMREFCADPAGFVEGVMAE
jgi:predicted ATPase